MSDYIGLWSGGKDSTIACNLVESRGNTVFRVFADNLRHSLPKSMHVKGTPYYRILSYKLMNYMYVRYNEEFHSDVLPLCPNVRPYQINCLLCQISMLLATIKFAKQQLPTVKGIIHGARVDQAFMPNTVEFSGKDGIFSKICEGYGLEWEAPLMEDGIAENLSMLEILHSDTLFCIEPQCWLGVPALPSGSDDVHVYIFMYDRILSRWIKDLMSLEFPIVFEIMH